MTLNQLAISAGTDLKWLQNASAILGRDLRRTPLEAKLWALIRMLVSALGVPLKIAYDIANNALRLERVGVQVVVHPNEDRVTSVVVDLHRFESVFNGNLSAALTLETPRRRGRPKSVRTDPIRAAVQYGIDVSLLHSSLALPVSERLERLDKNAEFLHELRAKR